MSEQSPAQLLRHELIAITGYRQKAKQAAWLRTQKIEFRLNAFGEPVVGRRYWETHSGQPKRRNNSAPNWEAIGVTP